MSESMACPLCGHPFGTNDDCAACNWQPSPSFGPPPRADGAELLRELREFVGRYVVLPDDHVADLIALWILHTHAIEIAPATPYLRIVSATAESGKTLLLEVMATLCRRGWHAINPSTPVLYRKIDAEQPTLLLDEFDNFPVNDRTEALQVLNAGYKPGATVDRCKESELEAFDCYCPKVYAGLDTEPLVTTLLSRSITIRLDRKAPHDQVEMWIGKLTEHEAGKLRRRCASWVTEHEAALQAAHLQLPANLPAGLANRALEVWWILLSIADLADGDWPQRVREAARILSTGGDDRDDRDDAVQLLADIEQAFAGNRTIHTSALLATLNKDDERPWGALRRGDGLDARGLAKMLRPFDVRRRSVRVGGRVAKGYHVDQFADAFTRYLESGSHGTHRSHPNAHREGDVTPVSQVTQFQTPPSPATAATNGRGSRADSNAHGRAA